MRVALFSLSLLLLSAIGCDNPTVYKIGVSQCSADDWRTKMNDEINRETMLHDDVVVEIRSADDSNARQIEDIWKTRSRMTPAAKVGLTPENKLFLTP